MKTPLAWLNLRHDVGRTAVAVAGVGFAALLIFIQLGFLGACITSATLIYDRLDFDLAVGSPEYVDLMRAGTIPRDRLTKVWELPGVTSVRPLSLYIHLWRNPESPERSRRNILILGIDPLENTFRHPQLDADAIAKLLLPHTVLLDRKSRPEFFGSKIVEGGSDDLSANHTDLYLTPVDVVGRFELGTGFGADGMVITSEPTFAEINGSHWRERVSLGLIRIENGHDPQVAEAAREHLTELLPDDVRVWTRDELLGDERRHWVWGTPLGKIFVAGAGLAFVIGVILVYQVMAGDISKRLAEYATLKAMGYGDGYLGGVVLRQAIYLGIGGFVPGLIVAAIVYPVASRLALLPMVMSVEIALLVLILTVAMCAASGWLALRKLHGADPADLF
jgi:putative ABC transport system permease protein